MTTLTKAQTTGSHVKCFFKPVRLAAVLSLQIAEMLKLLLYFADEAEYKISGFSFSDLQMKKHLVIY